VVGLTRTAALEYIKKGIYVNAVNPGLIDTQIARDVVSGNEEAYADTHGSGRVIAMSRHQKRQALDTFILRFKGSHSGLFDPIGDRTVW
jgi:NAD(P)-dependent dehydrogenase (short-subunit alcohol dehydrogenase family)